MSFALPSSPLGFYLFFAVFSSSSCSHALFPPVCARNLSVDVSRDGESADGTLIHVCVERAWRTQSSVGLHCGSLLWGCEIVPAEEDVRTWTGLTGFLQLLVVITKIFFVCEFNSGELSVVNATLNKRIIKYITDKKRHQTCARDAFSSWWLRAFHELNVASLSFLSELKRLWFTESQPDVFFFHVHLTWPDSLIKNTLMCVRHPFMKWSKSSNICY